MRKLLFLINIVAASMFATVSAAVGDVTTIVDQTFDKGTELTNTDADAFTWGSDIEGMISTHSGDSKKPYNKYGIFVTNNDNEANNYDARDFVTFTNPLGSATEELNVSYLVEAPQDQNNNNAYFEVNFYNDNGDFVFGIKEGSIKGWAFSSDFVYATEDGIKNTVAFPTPHMVKAGGSTVNINVTFNDTDAIIDVDGVKATAYTKIPGIKSIKFAVTGERDNGRPMVIRNLTVSTKEVIATQYAEYTLNYLCNGEIIDSKKLKGVVGDQVILSDLEKQYFFNDDKTAKYYYVSDDSLNKTIAADGSTVVTLDYREAYTYNYTVKNNVNDQVKTGSCIEGESVTVAYSRYILAENGTVWKKDPCGGDKKLEYRYTFTPDADNYIVNLDYTATDITNGIAFLEAETIEGMIPTSKNNADVRCSDAEGAYADEAVIVYTLKPGLYTVSIAGMGGSGSEDTKNVDFIVKAGENTILTKRTNGSWFEETSKQFTLTSETALTFEGANSSHQFDYILIYGTEIEPEDPVSRMNWDFTKWSDETIANLQAGSNWSDDEKGDGNTVNGNCYWQVSSTNDISINKYVKANDVSIEELKGLVYENNTSNRSLAIALNYPTTDKGTYHGPSYLWLGDKNGIDYFTIPGVPAGATIEMGVESHSASEGRGVQLSIAGEVLKAPDGTDVEAPTEYEEQVWFVPATAAATNDVQIKNTKGCHIYYIKVTPGAEVSGIAINDKDGKKIETLELKIGAAYQLSASITPDNAINKTVTWKSSNEEIATVDQTGRVTSVAKGEAEITATSSNGKTAVVAVTVVDAELVVESIALDKTEASVATGKTLQLTANVTPAEASVIWTSSNEEIAAVDENGVVTAISAGEAIITVQAGDKKASCTVTVTIPVEAITLYFNEITVEAGDQFTVNYTVSPEDATDKTIVWTSDNEEVATVDENGKVTAVAAGKAKITATSGNATASCTLNVESPAEGDVRLRMTYVDANNPDAPSGLIMTGESAKSGYNKISGGAVGFGNTSWNVNYITYIQVDASAVKDKYITSATLSFDASGSTDGKRSTAWGVGYNSSEWSSTMSYNTADKNITTLDDSKSTSTTSASKFETLSFDITEAINNAEGRIVTILVYETAAGGGYIKNPVVKIDSTNELVYKVTFAEANEVEGVKVTVNDQDATNGLSLSNGTYSFTATAPHYKDYAGEFTIADGDLTVEFEMTQKPIWNYTVKNNVNSEEIKGTVFEGEPATVAYGRYILSTDGTVWKKDPCGGDKKLEYNYSFTPDADNYEATLEYNATDMTDGIYFVEGEDIEGMTPTTNGNAGVRASNSLGGYSSESVNVCTLKPGKYIVRIAASGDKDKKLTVTLGEEELFTATTNGSWSEFSSEEFTVEADTELSFEGAAQSYPLDYILITGTEFGEATGIEITDKEGQKIETLELVSGEEYQLGTAITPEHVSDDTVNWSSADETVATVDENGKVTAVANGKKTTITATCGNVSASIVVKSHAQVGDAKMDGKVEINDAIDIANYVVGKKTVAEEDREFYVKAANANGDEEGLITFADASATVKIALDASTSASTQSRIRSAYDASADALVIGRASAGSRGTVIPVSLENAGAYVAFQADIILPEGMDVEVKAADAVAATHTLMTKKHADNHIRVALFNFGGNAFAAGEAPVIEIVTDSFVSASDIVITDIIASDADANASVLASKTAATNGVAAIGLDGDAPVKVYDINGIYVSDTMEALQQGTYIVRQGETAKTVRIR